VRVCACACACACVRACVCVCVWRRGGGKGNHNLIESSVLLVLVGGSPQNGSVDIKGTREAPLYWLRLTPPFSLLCEYM